MSNGEQRGTVWDDPLSRPAHGQGHGGTAYPSEAGAIGKLQFQVEELYKRMSPREVVRPRPTVLFEAVASMPGALIAETNSTLYYPPSAADLVSVTLSLLLPGTATTTVRVWRNLSDLIDIISIASSVRVVTQYYSEAFTPEDSFNFEIATPGANAEGLTAQGRFG